MDESRWAFYDLLQERAHWDAVVKEVLLGSVWTLCRAGLDSDEGEPGLAMSPAGGVRTLQWAGTLVGRPLPELQSWVRSWKPHEASVGMAAINAGVAFDNELPQQSVPLPRQGYANLAVFEHFLPQLSGKRVAVVGRYPGLERYADILDMTVLERAAGADDLPDPACEFVLPESDWVFLTATSIVNKTFHRLAELSKDAKLVLMGPTTPWLTELADFGVDYLAGVKAQDPQALYRTVAEGGGTRIFETGVQYHVLDLRQSELERLAAAIAGRVRLRDRLKQEMESWYADHRRQRFPGTAELLRLDQEMSALDSRYKQLWDAQENNSKQDNNRMTDSR